MLRAGFSAEQANEACDRATEAGYLNDGAFAASAVARRSAQGRGTRLIAAELRQKGLDGALVSAALAAMDPDQEFESALALAKRHVSRTLRMEPRERRQRILARLYRTGFTEATARRAYAAAAGAEGISEAGPLVNS